MSGFEIAGVVLGVLPLVIDALATYREGKGPIATTIKFRGLLEDLIRQLKDQQTFFYLDMKLLLQKARVDEAANELFEKQCAALLRDKRTKGKLSKYLGNLYRHFRDVLGHYEKCLKELTSKLDHIMRPENVAKDDLNAIIYANSDPWECSGVRGRLRFTIDRKSLGALMKGLEVGRCSLEKLMAHVKTQQGWEARQSSGESTRMAEFFGQVQTGAWSLHKAACKFWVCDQHDKHTVLIQLQNRIVNPSRFIQPAHIKFRLCFPTREAMLQEIDVKTYIDKVDRVNAGMQTGTCEALTRHGGNLSSITAPTTSIGITQPTGDCIVNICEHARQARERGHIIALNLAADVFGLNDETIRPEHWFKSTTTLADFLTNISQNQEMRMMPTQQTLLALNVATAVLQLGHTPWCGAPWDSRTIKFLVKEDGSPVACAPYIEKAVRPALVSTEPSHPSPNMQSKKATVLELAILMLEILHNKSLETWAAENQHQDSTATFFDRLKAAIRWVELSSNKLLPNHLGAVEACLTQCMRGNTEWDLDFEKFCCENIVQPLQQLVLPRSLG